MSCIAEATTHLRGLCMIEHAGQYRKSSGNPVFRCHFLQHECHVTTDGTEPATRGWAAGIPVLSLQMWHIKITLLLANWATYWEERWGSKNRLWAVTVFSLLVQTRRNVMGGGGWSGPYRVVWSAKAWQPGQGVKCGLHTFYREINTTTWGNTGRNKKQFT